MNGRRQFIGHLAKTSIGLLAMRGLAIGAVTGGALALEGCNVIEDIENWVPVGEAALNSILTMLTANDIMISPAITGIVNLIETAFNDLLAAVKEYAAVTPPPVGAGAKIQVALQAVADQFSNFISQLSGIAGKVLSVVVGLAKIVISTAMAFVGQLPASASAMAVRLSPALSVAPKHRTRRVFKKDWNKQLDAASAVGVACPGSAYLKLTVFEHF